MIAFEAALKVLQKENKPLNYREITKRIIADNLWQCDGMRPEATINAQLAMNIKKYGKAALFLFEVGKENGEALEVSDA